MAHELRAREDGIVGHEDLADLVEPRLEGAQTSDRLGMRDLVNRELAVASVRIDMRRLEHAELAVVAHRANREAGEPGKPSDRERLVLAEPMD